MRFYLFHCIITPLILSAFIILGQEILDKYFIPPTIA